VNFDITLDKLQAEELENARTLLEYESRHDALTALANRRKLDEVFLERVANSQSAATLLHLDIDHFKQINDTLGHAAGDAALQHAANVLRRHMTGDVLISRVGGDEFVVLLFEVPAEQELEATAESIIREMSRPFCYRSMKCSIGVSIGIAICQNCDGVDRSLFIDADLALYEAKKAGRGRYRFFSPSMKEEARWRKETFDALSSGIENGEILCHYQPQFDAVTLKLSGLEALVRWERIKVGLIMPHQFLGVAEDMGLLSKIDDIVLHRVLHDISTWEKAGITVPPISVNVSASRLNDPTFADQLVNLNIPVGMLSFELLETAFLDTKSSVVDRNLGIIKDLGINIEIDDFGSGHASIAGLLSVTPTRLKIDHTLVGPISTSERQRELVKNIIGIGHMLGIRVVAEGVETPAHIEILKAMHCDFLQGFGLSRPMDGAKTCQFIAKHA
jgi:diguanylate cyclase (GGDEF)-like protein